MFDKTFSYVLISKLISDIKLRWQSKSFDTGEDLVKFYQDKDILCIEITDTEMQAQSSAFKNDLLFKIIDQRYTAIKKGLFRPTLIITVTHKNKSFLDTVVGVYDKAVVGRIRELGARNVFKFPKIDIRESIAKADVDVDMIPDPDTREAKYGRK